MTENRRVVVCGSTGSIGTQTLDVVRTQPDMFDVIGLCAGTNSALLEAQAAEFGVALERALIAPSPEQLYELASLGDADVVMNGIVGFAGLSATLGALESGKTLALANKESLIAAGPVVAKARANGGGRIIPVDSEHSAIYQSLRSGQHNEIQRIVLTASGGPFRGKSRSELSKVSVADALAHPTWKMGNKITIDSSTLMNKGFEVIEAHELFGIDFDHIDVVVHPESIVHGMVEFTDGATIAQLSTPDMRLPIGLSLADPARFSLDFGALDWSTVGSLTFDAPDRETFRCLDIAYEAGRQGGSAPAVLNAANEVVVEEFLAGAFSWLEIADTLEQVLDAAPWPVDDLEAVRAADEYGRHQAREVVRKKRI